MAVGATNRTGDEELEHLLSKPIKDHFFKLNGVEIVFWAEFADSFTYKQLRENCRRNQTFVPLNIVSEKFLDIFVSTFFIFRAGAWCVELLLDDWLRACNQSLAPVVKSRKFRENETLESTFAPCTFFQIAQIFDRKIRRKGLKYFIYSSWPGCALMSTLI